MTFIYSERDVDMKISICIPMYNENAVIAQTARTLSEYMQAHFADYEIIFCSDGSIDGCDETVRALGLPNVSVISNSPNKGKGYAVRTAMLAASGDVRMFTDADLAYGTDVIERFVKSFEEGTTDVAIGSRNLCKDGYLGYTPVRKIASRLYFRILGAVGRVKISDSQCGCKAYSARAAEQIFSKCEVNGFAFDFETLLWARKLGFTIREVPVRILNHGTSKVDVFKDPFRMLRDVHRMKKRINKQKGE